MRLKQYLIEGKYKIKKSSLGDYNRGQTGPNNCYYKGTSTCWVITSKDEEIIGISRKKDAERFLEFVNDTKWDGKGDPAMLYMKWATKKGYNIDKFKEV